MNNKWCVVVGQPKRASTWAGSKPDLTQVGRCVLGGNGDATFFTRKEAREYAKQISLGNNWWNYHARKYQP